MPRVGSAAAARITVIAWGDGAGLLPSVGSKVLTIVSCEVSVACSSFDRPRLSLEWIVRLCASLEVQM